MQYDVYLDDEMLVSDAPFKGQGVQALGMYNYHHHTAWFDEIFVGRDDDQAFRLCPFRPCIPYASLWLGHNILALFVE